MTTNSSDTRAVRGTLVGVIVLALLAPSAVGETTDQPIRFQALAEALRRGAATERVTAIYFTADWCGWCRKMHGTTFADPKVRAAATGFAWAKVDIDEAPAVAARFAVQGVPALVLLNIRGQTLDRRSGFLSPKALLAWLETYADQAAASPPAQRQQGRSNDALATLNAGDAGKAEQAVVQIVQIAARSDRAERAAAREGISTAAERAWPGLVACLADRRLAVRAAAYDLLAAATDARPAFDPFGPPPQRAQQLYAWRRWLEQNRATQPES